MARIVPGRGPAQWLNTHAAPAHFPASVAGRPARA
jgi:hypothetical protein